MKIIFKNRCYNGGNKHKFRARYSQRNSRDKISINGFSGTAQQLNLILHEVYLFDICEWCGKIVKNEVKDE